MTQMVKSAFVALMVLAVAGPLAAQALVALIPPVLVIGAVVVVVRLVWFYTQRW